MKHRLITLFGFLLTISITGVLFSQSVMKANPDNFFVTPIPVGGSLSTTFLDVLQNDYYADDATIGDLVVTIPGYPVKGDVQYDAASFRLEYYPFEGETGMDSLVYEIKSPITGKSALGKVYIHINSKPDVISNADCFVDPEGISFEIKMLAESDSTLYLSANDTPLVGNLDDDDDIEIVIFGTGSTATIHQDIKIFSFNKQQNEIIHKYTIPFYSDSWTLGNIAMAKITAPIGYNLTYPKNRPSIFVYEPRYCAIIRYDLEDDGSGNLEYQETWRKVTTQTNRYSAPIPFIVDLMGDGHQQVVVADKIYDADSGILLTQATDINNDPIIDHSAINSNSVSTYSFGLFGHPGASKLGNSNRTYGALMVVGDIDNDGILELVGGDCVYKVNITDYTNEYTSTSANTYKFHTRANKNGHTEIGDGAAALTDVNNDGYLEVVVVGPVGGNLTTTTKGTIYVYDPRTGTVLHTNSIIDIPRNASIYGPAMPFVGDIDGDGVAEFCVSAFCTLRAYELNGSVLEEMWNLPTTDTSAATTLSLFDFAQDGKAKLIYRDETDLRILDARKYDDNNNLITNTDRVLATFPRIYSGTINEYSIVADVNGDGAAEIITVGTGVRNVVNPNGRIKVYGAAGAKKWAPARSVWNQIAYNPVYVNDDLTIPRNPMSPAATFASSDGSINRPFNNFLQQATSLNKEGAMIMEGADLTFSSRAPRRLKFEDNGDLTITVTVVNQGLVSWTDPIRLQMYCSHNGTPVTYTSVGTAHVDANSSGLAARGERVMSFTIPKSSLPADGSYEGWAITVNLDTDPGDDNFVYSYGKECRSGLNNRALGFNVLSGSAIACKGALNVPVHVSPSGQYNVSWYTLGGANVANATNTYILPKKDNSEVTKLLVQAYNKSTGTLVSNVRDTVYVYSAPDSLVWTNSAGDRDWHNPENWRKGGVSNDATPFANIPVGCTVVTLLGGMSEYPNLTDITSSTPALGGTDYSDYSYASCSKIYFNFGSELTRPDLLVYDSARVESKLESHRWYMYAPPLKNMYSGDFYMKSAIPKNDDLKSYTKSWGGLHPFWGSHFESSWTTIYSLPDVEYPVGHGLGVWISDNQDRDNVFFDFKFPKKDLKHHVYFKDTDIVNTYYETKSLSRSDAHRFIFDGLPLSSGSDFSLPVEANNSGSIVFVGNPFMSHLDFDKFYAANSGKIKREYKILNRNNNTYLYYRFGQSSTLSHMIAPMQGFLVEALVPFTELTVNGNMSVEDSGNTLRGVQESSDIQEFTLPLTVRQSGASDVTYLRFGSGYSKSYDSDDDVICLFDESGNSGSIRPVGFYSVSGDGVKLNFQSLPLGLLQGTYSVALGIRTPSRDNITVNVGNLGSLPAGVSLSLYDSKTDQEYALNHQSMYSFTDIDFDGDSFMTGRLYLKISNSQTGLMESDSSSLSVQAFCRANHLSVFSSKSITRVEVLDLNGSLILSKSVDSVHFSESLSYSPVYILRVFTEEGVETLKVIND